MVCSDADIKLLRHFFLSYELFFKTPGNIHLFIWQDSQSLLDQIHLPDNLIVHYKDTIPELVEDDYRNQMYLKLISHRYVETPWYWIVDADYLICSPLTFSDFFDQNKPYWFYTPWMPLPEQTFRLGTEDLLQMEIPLLFLDEPQFVMSRAILEDMNQQYKLVDILTHPLLPADCIAYGAFAHKYHHEQYHWVNAQEGNQFICYKINQRPPTYQVFPNDADLSLIGDSRYCVFWSHWDLAEEKMRQFLCEAQERYFGKVISQPDSQPLQFLVTPQILVTSLFKRMSGQYLDSWVKPEMSFTLYSEQAGCLTLLFETLHCTPENQTVVTLTVSGQVKTIPFIPGQQNKIVLNVPEKARLPARLQFNGGIKEPGTERVLFARIIKICFESEESHKIMDASK